MLPASAVPLSTGVVSLVSDPEVSVGVAGTLRSSVKLPVPAVALPAASVLRSVTGLTPSPPRLNWPSVGVAAPVSSIQVPLAAAVTW
jgi:hypothetical protein